MATHASVEGNLKAGLNLVLGGPVDGGSSHRRSNLGGSGPASQPQASANRRMRRTMTREQGRAIETIGHAVDYLNDCYIHEGPDSEVLDFRGPGMDAVRVLVVAQREILATLPLAEPFTLRLWHALLGRKSQLNSTPVVPLSSSR
ncbi:MAG: hypothetical protein ABI164_04415 [Acidobacteriaceae bacterium]